MRAVSPVLPASLELEQIYGAEDGSDRYELLPTFRTDKAVVSRWVLTNEERAHIAAGGDLFVAILNYSQPIWPILPIAAEPDQVLSILLAAEEKL
jgi:hypothetical protein